MFIAIHERSGELVSGKDVINPENRFADTDQYHCILCKETIEFNRGVNKYDIFRHREGNKDCFSRPKNSTIHQIGCEMAIKTACNLGYSPRIVKFEKEIRSNGMTRTDVILGDQDPVVIEVFHRSRMCGLHRRLKIITEAGYACYIVCTVPKYNPAHKPTKFDNSLSKLGPIEVGRFDPESDEITLGTRITSNIVDFESVNYYKDYIL